MDACIILAGGPSVGKADLAYIRDHRASAHVIAINDMGSPAWAPWADTLYGCDPAWWHHAKKRPLWEPFAGRRICLAHGTLSPPAGVTPYPAAGSGVILGAQGLADGGNSVYQAINLAVLEGTKLIVLYGVDMQYGARGVRHCYGNHPPGLGNFSPGVSDVCIKHFNRLAPVLRTRSIRVLNATRETALTCFKRASVEDAMHAVEALAAEAGACSDEQP